MTRPMMILAGERQLGQLNVPELRAKGPIGGDQSAGKGWHSGTTGKLQVLRCSKRKRSTASFAAPLISRYKYFSSQSSGDTASRSS